MDPPKTNYLYFVAAGLMPRATRCLPRRSMSTTATWPTTARRRRKRGNDEAARSAACARCAGSSAPAFGMFLFIPTTRHLPVPKAPAIVQSATPDQLVAQLNQRWDALNNLTAIVEIHATETQDRRRHGEGFSLLPRVHCHAQAQDAARAWEPTSA